MGIIPADCIAGVTREKQFAGHYINTNIQNTKVVFMDEWSIDSLNAEDEKKVLQGGLFMLPRKHKEAEKFAYNSGYYITTNEVQNVGQGSDDRPIKRRLSVFETVPFLNPRNRVSDWLRKNCFHYCAEQLKDEPLFSENEFMNDDDVGNEGYDSDKGAKYNNYNTQPSKLLRTDTFKSLSFCTSDTDFTHGDAVEASMVPEEMLEKVSLNVDQRIPGRWTKSHGLFVNEGDINSEEYHKRVLKKLIAIGKWRKVDLNVEDAKRFDRRHRTCVWCRFGI